MITIEELQTCSSADPIDEALVHIETEEQLCLFIRAYADWNSVFASGVTALTSLVGSQHALFLDKGAPRAVRDRSMLIASHIFDAARDEYDDGAQGHRDPHRTLAQATLLALADITGNKAIVESGTLDWLQYFREVTMKGYTGSWRRAHPTGWNVFAGIGYHLGSELLADQEFSKIDTMMRDRFNDIVQKLMRTTVELHGSKHRCYAWIGVHSGAGGGVEMDHFQAGLDAANLALKYLDPSIMYADEAKACIMEGFQQFAEDQKRFFQSITRELHP